MKAKQGAPFLCARGLSLHYGQTAALSDIHFELARGEILCLLGPSGCGKTSLLRLIAGLEIPDAGQLQLTGQDLIPIPTHERGIGFMFQDFALFPHLDVVANVRFGLKMAGLPRDEQERRAREALAQVGLAAFADRDVAQLSGGEKQRVALARSLVPRPRLLLLDEPLGSLDANTREALGEEIRSLILAAGLAAIYVTHDRREACAIADRIAIVRAGRMLQVAEPAAFYHTPRTPFVARFFGQRNIFPVLAADDESIRTALGEFALPDRPRQVLFHSRGIQSVHADAPGALPGEIRSCTFRGAHYEIRSEHHGQLLQYTLPSSQAPPPQPGDRCAIRIDPTAVIPFAGD